MNAKIRLEKIFTRAKIKKVKQILKTKVGTLHQNRSFFPNLYFIYQKLNSLN